MAVFRIDPKKSKAQNRLVAIGMCLDDLVVGDTETDEAFLEEMVVDELLSIVVESTYEATDTGKDVYRKCA